MMVYGAYTENDTAFVDFVARGFVFWLGYFGFCTQVRGRDGFVVLYLSAYLRSDRVGPRLQRQVEVRAKYTCERLRGDEGFVQIPNETVAYPVRLRLEFDAYGDQCRRFFCLCVYCCLRAVAGNQVRGSARLVQHTAE